MKVRDVMSTDVVTVDAATPFPDLVDLLLRHEVSGLPVVDDEGRLVGMVTEADLVSKEAYGGRRRRALQVLADLVQGGETRWAIKGKGRTAGHIMSSDLVTVRPSDTVRDTARHMLENGVKRVPVVDEGRLVGIVSRADVLRILHRADSDLEDDLTRMLADIRWAPDDHDVTASVEGGVATFEGSVRFPMDLRLISAIGWQLPAIVDVVNEVTAREPNPQAS